MPTLIDKTPPSSFARKKFIDPVRNKRTQNVDLEPTKLDVLRLNKTLPQAVSVKPQVDLYKGLDPAIVPDVPASYIQQPDRSFQNLVARPDQFHKYQTTQREAEESVGFFLDQELKREMAETNLNPYMYSRKQAKAENELNRLINQPTRRLAPQEIFALENRILGADPRLLPDYTALSYIVRNSALLDFIRDRNIFTNMTAWKTSFMNVLNNTFARLRINKPEWFNTVLADNGKDPLMTPGVDLSGFQNMTAASGHPTEQTEPSRRVERTPSGERTIVHAPPVAPSMVTPPVPAPVQPPVTAPTAPTPQPVFSVTAGGPPSQDAPGVGNRAVEDFAQGVERGIGSGLEAASRFFDPTGTPVQVPQQSTYDVAEIPEEEAGIVTQPRPTPGQQMMSNFFQTLQRQTTGPVEEYSPPTDYGVLSFINSVTAAAQKKRSMEADVRITRIAQKANDDHYNSDLIKEAVTEENVAIIHHIDYAIAFLISILEYLRGKTREQRPINTAIALLNQYKQGKKKNP
jgi:hypothetical protein